MGEKSVQDNVQGRFPKSDARYWKDRLFRSSYTINGKRKETSTWCIKISHLKHRETFNLQTSNKQAAAVKAATIYKKLLALGWDPVLKEYKPKQERQAVETVGQLIAAIVEYDSKSRATTETLTDYFKCFRRIAADIAGVKRDSVAKFDYFNRGHLAYRESADRIKLKVITPITVQTWMSKQIVGVDSPLELSKKMTTANTVLRQAKSLVSTKRLKCMPPDIRSALTAWNPFSDVESFPVQDATYRRKFDLKTLLGQAQNELSQNHETEDEWIAFLLLLIAGLRRKEADLLLWTSTDLNKGIVRIELTDYFKAKSRKSLREIALPPLVTKILKSLRAKRPNDEFVLRSDASYAPHATDRRYRCQKVFKNLIQWLKSKGLQDQKLLHLLRKGAGDEIATSYGLLAASRFLGHSSVNVTASHYADGRGAIVDIGGILHTRKKAKKDLQKKC